MELIWQSWETLLRFKATISLLERTDEGKLAIKDIYNKCNRHCCKKKRNKKITQKLYNNFSDKDISDEIARLLEADNIKADFNVIYQLPGLHGACPNHKGDCTLPETTQQLEAT